MGTYLGAIDLVTQNQVTIFARVGINPSDRLVGDIAPGNTQITVYNKSVGIKQVGTQISAELNVTRSIADNMGGTQLFNPVDTPLSFYSTPPASGYSSFNKQVGTDFGSLTATATNFSSQLFNTPGTYSWTVPEGVTSISVAGVGGGGGGSQKTTGGSGGGGGLISYSNSISVTPGTTCTIVVGGGGVTGSTFGLNGSSTYMLLPGSNVPIVIAQGGAGGDSIYWLSNSIGTASYTDASGIVTTQSAYDPAGGNITYSISSGSLPSGASFNTSTGAISWTFQNLLADTEYTPFNISATNGTQTITKPFTLKILKVRLASYLIVGGGGSGGASFGGGGGAGGLLSGTANITPGATYTITVGGGAAQSAAADSTIGLTGQSSSALGLTALGGGGGGSYLNAGGSNTSGGSGGGGGSSETNTTYAGAGGTAGQGNNGGAGLGVNGYVAGGGGGAFSVGQPAVASTRGGNGGTGTFTTLISTTTAISLGIGQYVTATNAIYFAGGGGGASYQYSNGTIPGVGGPGGGGNATGGQGVRGTAAQGYTGGGGGGGGYTAGGGGGGGAGAGGIVIISYADTAAAATTPLGNPTYIVSGGFRTYVFTSTGSIIFN